MAVAAPAGGGAAGRGGDGSAGDRRSPPGREMVSRPAATVARTPSANDRQTRPCNEGSTSRSTSRAPSTWRTPSSGLIRTPRRSPESGSRSWVTSPRASTWSTPCSGRRLISDDPTGGGEVSGSVSVTLHPALSRSTAIPTGRASRNRNSLAPPLAAVASGSSQLVTAVRSRERHPATSASRFAITTHNLSARRKIAAGTAVSDRNRRSSRSGRVSAETTTFGAMAAATVGNGATISPAGAASRGGGSGSSATKGGRDAGIGGKWVGPAAGATSDATLDSETLGSTRTNSITANLGCGRFRLAATPGSRRNLTSRPSAATVVLPSQDASDPLGSSGMAASGIPTSSVATAPSTCSVASTASGQTSVSLANSGRTSASSATPSSTLAEAATGQASGWAIRPISSMATARTFRQLPGPACRTLAAGNNLRIRR